ncbi:MAG: DNA-processing protein DprA [Salinivirgaceae bacterium]|nr:DNA-processing protein DprA [Salinivirgaceae bacterium]
MDQTTPSTRDCLALWAVPKVGILTFRKLLANAGNIQNVFKFTRTDWQKFGGITDSVYKAITKTDYYKVADQTLEFAQKFGIRIITWFDDDYPHRLKQCDDGPLVLFVKGDVIENNRKYIAMVGTRNCTKSGASFCEHFVSEVSSRYPDACIVSGLAYGVDIAAHKAALNCGLKTYGVLAHGLDTIYPPAHRDYAAKMVKCGGLVSEFLPGVFPDKSNFVRRNRIIAGLSDLVVVVESDVKGGSLITAEYANDYNREVFAVPGRFNDQMSAGCNLLIRNNAAHLASNFADVEYIMGWDTERKPVQTKIVFDLQPDEQRIVDTLKKENEMPIDELCRLLGMPMSKLSSILLTMELDGYIKCLPGKVYTLS